MAIGEIAERIHSSRCVDVNTGRATGSMSSTGIPFTAGASRTGDGGADQPVISGVNVDHDHPPGASLRPSRATTGGYVQQTSLAATRQERGRPRRVEVGRTGVALDMLGIDEIHG